MNTALSRPLGYCASQVDAPNMGLREKNLLSLSYGNIIQKDIAGNDGLLPESFENYNVVKSGDTVLRLTDLQNDQRSLRVGFVKERGIITSAYVTLRPHNDVDPRFFSYVLKSMDFRKDFYALGAGVRQSLKFDELKRVQIHLPSPALQRTIADYLDKETTRIDSLITKKREMIGLLRERFSSEIENALNNGHFRKSRLRWCSIRIADGTHGTYQRQVSGYPLLSSKNLRNGCVTTSEDESFISESDYREISKTCGFRPGDVLYGVIGGSIGNVARFQDGDPTAFQRSVAAVSPSELLLADFLYLVSLGRDFQDQLRLAANSSAQAGVYLGALGDIAIPLPSKPEQEQIVYFLMHLLRSQESVENAMIRQIDLFQKQRQALVIAAVTGEIEVSGEAA